MVLENNLLLDKNLDPQEVTLHHKRLTDETACLHFKILNTLTLENGGIIDLEKLTLPESKDKFASFVPSAGAASRYYAIIKNLLVAIENKDLAQIKSELDLLELKDLKSWAIPAATRDVLVQKDANLVLQKASLILKEIGLPKALQPAFTEGTSFLDVKNLEHQELSQISKQIFIINPTAKADFNAASKGKDFIFLDQGPKLSTIRFKRDGEAYKDHEGSYTVVPAGHGSLTKLIPEVAKIAPECSSILIRNIDNVNGTKKEVLDETRKFLDFHSFVLSAVKKIRLLLQDDLKAANDFAEQCLSQLNLSQASKDEVKIYANPHLWQLLSELFHLQPDYAQRILKSFGSEQKSLAYLYARPVNTVGQVPNSGNDVGASPVLCEDDKGRQFVMALEPPHATPKDRKDILENPKVATHFNPAFVAAEIITDASVYKNPEYDLWIKAEKQFKGVDVMYHETVLYELLGNSIMANACFPAIKRILFNPHKSIKDTTLHNKSHFFQ